MFYGNTEGKGCVYQVVPKYYSFKVLLFYS